MTDADIAVYDKAFVKLDKDKDGFIALHGKLCSEASTTCLGHLLLLHQRGSAND